MNPPPAESSDSLVVAGTDQPRRGTDQQPSGVAAGAGRHARGAPGAHRATAVRSPLRHDYRLRSLDAQPSDPVTTMATRMDGLRRRRRHVPRLAGVAVLAAVAALAALLLQNFVVQPFSVPGNAMTPTVKAGDRILVLKSGVLLHPISAGEIVVFQPPQSLPCTVAGSGGGDLVLRVVALPGQTIWSVGDTIYVDKRPLRDRGWYDPRFGQLGSTPIVSTTLGRGQYYVLADNRSDSCDSRVFGPVAKSSIVGAGLAVVGRYGHVFFRML